MDHAKYLPKIYQNAGDEIWGKRYRFSPILVSNVCTAFRVYIGNGGDF